MDNIRIKNYRCFDDTGAISIKPITVLVGANSSGKSSFLKFFGLMKQSVSEFIRGFFLWSGPLIDFKDFNNVVKDTGRMIELDFDINELPIYSDFKLYREKVKNVHIHLAIGKDNEDIDFDYLRVMIITFDDNKFEFYYNYDRSVTLVVNGLVSHDIGDNIIWRITNSLFPKISFISNNNDFDDEHSYNIYKRLKEIFTIKGKQRESFFYIKSFSNRFVKNKLVDNILNLNKNTISLDDADYIAVMSMYYSINTFIDSLNYYMLNLSKKMTYVMPLRAIVQRYYRFNNYAVESIDADGHNLPMFFNGLSTEAFDDFNENWLCPIFGFKLYLKPSGEGHLELLVEEKGKPIRNLIDVGFGYTQILPILTIIWKSIFIDCIKKDETKDFCKTHIIAIEQPELHLHPRFQGMFVDMLDRVINICHRMGKDVRIIIETHSEIIINRLGVKVMDDESYIDKEDVNVLIFNAKAEGFDTDVVSSKYNEEGYLSNWPFGFFSDNVY